MTAKRGRAGRAVRTDAPEVELGTILLAVETSAACAARIAAIGEGAAGWPTIGTLAPIQTGARDPARTVSALGRARRLVGNARVVVAGDRPFVHQAVRLPVVVWQRLAGHPAAPPFSVGPLELAALDRVGMAPSTRAEANEVAAHAARTRSLPLVVVSGPPERAAEAEAVASGLGCAARFVHAAIVDDGARLSELRREPRWLGAALVVRGAPRARRCRGWRSCAGADHRSGVRSRSAVVPTSRW